MEDWQKDYQHGTLVIWPTGDAARVSNQLRMLHDPQTHEYCSAHITVTQPFRSPPTDHTWSLIDQIVQATPPFWIHVGPIEFFGQSSIVKFDVEPKSVINSLRQQLHATGLFNLTLPHTDGFTPHMTISESGLPADGADATTVEVLNTLYETMQFRASRLTYIRPDPSFCFHEERSFAFGLSS